MIKFDEHQLQALNACKTNEYADIFITGGGGTGKSAIIKEVVKYFKKQRIHTVLLAPTNSASKNIGGQTLHSYFGLTALEQIEAKNEGDFIVFDNFKPLDSNLDKQDRIMIVDEVSMIGQRIMNKTIDKVNPTKLILLGDVKQLPPPKDKTVDWFKRCEKVYTLHTNYRATNPIVNEQIDYFKETGKIHRDIETFKKSDFNSKTKVIAFTNKELSRLQKSILGYDNGRMGDNVILSGVVISYGKKIFDNGDEVELAKKVKGNAYIDLSGYNSLNLFGIRSSIELDYPIYTILGDYGEYTRLKDNLYSKMKKVIKNLITLYDVKDAKSLWKLYKNDKLSDDDSNDLKASYYEYMKIKNTPYSRHNQFITTYKAQGKGYDNVAITFYNMPNKEHKYVAISRAINKIRVIKRDFR